MEWILLLLKAIPDLAKLHSRTLVTVLVIALATLTINIKPIYEYCFKRDVVRIYLERGKRVESSLKVFRNDFKCDGISVAILHNGVVSIADPNFHLMKFSILFSVGDNARATKTVYINQPLSIWIDNFNEMLRKGFFIIKDASTDKDPLVRRVYASTGKKTQLYLPMFKDEALIGYAIISWKEKTILTDEDIRQMKRTLLHTESRL